MGRRSSQSSSSPHHPLCCMCGYSYGGASPPAAWPTARDRRVTKVGALGSLANALRRALGLDRTEEEADRDHHEAHKLDAHRVYSRRAADAEAAQHDVCEHEVDELREGGLGGVNNARLVEEPVRNRGQVEADDRQAFRDDERAMYLFATRPENMSSSSAYNVELPRYRTAKVTMKEHRLHTKNSNDSALSSAAGASVLATLAAPAPSMVPAGTGCCCMCCWVDGAL
eukprot:CAMPEP_0115888876 /NCGR_PEP_ID=MMETSP0287-20121206/32533_1 /TAXON_ID=412157 /ORGANISM="Chrysochromulina rotalis, Strain UIO044" /LENGTH=226 /DNA_ID=CAMNT_0003345573 /DNA_START=269 /DNA_END=949 /DNA_ORIENTATION=+